MPEANVCAAAMSVWIVRTTSSSSTGDFGQWQTKSLAPEDLASATA